VVESNAGGDRFAETDAESARIMIPTAAPRPSEPVIRRSRGAMADAPTNAISKEEASDWAFFYDLMETTTVQHIYIYIYT